jgi:hypothetical protein
MLHQLHGAGPAPERSAVPGGVRRADAKRRLCARGQRAEQSPDRTLAAADPAGAAVRHAMEDGAT